jgi:hypothetical protein
MISPCCIAGSRLILELKATLQNIGSPVCHGLDITVDEVDHEPHFLAGVPVQTRRQVSFLASLDSAIIKIDAGYA